MSDVNRQVNPGDALYLYGNFNSDPVVFYRGAVINELDRPVQSVAAMIGKGDDYLIMTRQTWREIQKMTSTLSAPLLESEGRGAEGDCPANLVQAEVP